MEVKLPSIDCFIRGVYNKFVRSCHSNIDEGSIARDRGKINVEVEQLEPFN